MTIDNAADLARALHAKRNGPKGGWAAKCPAHDDRVASLAIKDGKDGVVVHCHAGCSQEAVIDKLKAKGLWQAKSSSKPAAKPRIVQSYDYLDDAGAMVFQVVRLEPKTFRQRRMNGKGWIWNLEGVAPLVYRLPELIEAVASSQTVFVVEGEKDVEAAAKIGIAATCNAGGAKKWRAEHAAFLAGADVVIIPDNDQAGKEHAEVVAKSLDGVAARVRVLALPGLPPKGDLSDWTAAGGTADELWRLVAEAKDWQDGTTLQASWRDQLGTMQNLQRRTFPPVDELIPSLLPTGVTLFVGRPKIGKSWMVLDIALGISGNRHVFGGIKAVQGDVLYVALEDNPRRMQKRVDKLLSPISGEWPSRCFYANSWNRLDQGGLDDLAAWIGSVPDPRLIIIDTFAGFRPARPKTGYAEDYADISALQQLAAAHKGLGIVVVHHTRKMEAEDPLDATSGTLGLVAAADTILVLERKAGSVTLYGRGRDIEEFERAMEFQAASCKWRVLGDAVEVQRSDTRKLILSALSDSTESLSVLDIAIACNLTREVVDQRLFHMVKAGEVAKVARGRYELPVPSPEGLS